MSWTSIQFAELEKGLKSFHGKRPANQLEAFHLLTICHNAPKFALEESKDADAFRRQYMRLLTEFPDFTAAALQFLNKERKRRVTRTFVIEEFLLSESHFERNGKRIPLISMADCEIAGVLQERYGQIDNKVISEGLVKRVRERLEKRFGVDVHSLTDFCVRLHKLADPSLREEEWRDMIFKGFYEATYNRPIALPR